MSKLIANATPFRENCLLQEGSDAFDRVNRRTAFSESELAVGQVGAFRGQTGCKQPSEPVLENTKGQDPGTARDPVGTRDGVLRPESFDPPGQFLLCNPQIGGPYLTLRLDRLSRRAAQFFPSCGEEGGHNVLQDLGVETLCDRGAP
ncbi:elongation factor tu gtp binding domain containing protein [Lasius niger]|uniref:Elongation factor tu gtp binding domain containing protein n=1 Tax=Lasius niger TaxID=67767 RepID=A0A0J7K0X2_LASNI|nr:elongation factor tu gtp binding domain containing protein [Lasius niger]